MRMRAQAAPYVAIFLLMTLPAVSGYMAFDSGGAYLFPAQWTSDLRALAFFSSIAGIPLGAVFVGAEWRSGAMQTLLTWRSNRGLVLTAKLVAVVIGMAVLSIVVAFLALLVGGILPASKGLTYQGGWGDVMSAWTDIVFVLGYTATFGAGLATLFRHYLPPILIFIGLVFFEPLFGLLLPDVLPYLLNQNLLTVLNDTAGSKEIAVMSGYLGAVVLVAYVSMTRRDV